MERSSLTREDNPTISFVIPCLNEEASLAHVLREIHSIQWLSRFKYEIVVADNGSRDSSVKIAVANNARVVHVTKRGYGAAIRGGISQAFGDVIVMGDADGSYKFSESERLVEGVLNGADLVMGNRFRGGIARDAMPFLHRYLGNPLLSFLGRLMFRVKIGDFHCGLRAFSREKIVNLGLISDGMEFASEMIIKAKRCGLEITEYPVSLSPDLRGRKPHLRTWSDGLRHLKLLIKFSPSWLFLPPASVLFATVIALVVLGFAGPVDVANREVSIRTASAVTVLSVLLVVLLHSLEIIRMSLVPDWRRSYLVRFRTMSFSIGAVAAVGGVIGVIPQMIDWLQTETPDSPNLGSALWFLMCLFGIGVGVVSITFTLIASLLVFHRE